MSGQSEGSSGGFWACRRCGNVVLRGSRPTRCYCCRTGEAEQLAPQDRERLYRLVEDRDLDLEEVEL